MNHRFAGAAWKLLLLVLADGVAAGSSRIVVAGDLTAMSHATARPPRTGWAQVLDRYTDLPILLMRAEERAKASEMAAVLEPGMTTLAHDDLLLIQLASAAKDEGASTIVESDLATLRQLIETARARGARPVLLGSLARREFTADGRALDTQAERDNLLRGLASEDGLVFIDLGVVSRAWLEALGPEASKAWFFHDPATGYSDLAELHERGAVAVACLVVNELLQAQLLAPEQLVRALECELTPRTGTAPRRAPILEHIDAVPTHGIERHGSSGLALAAELFRNDPAAPLEVSRLVLHDGAAVGVHQHAFDEIFYVISGHAELSIDGQAHPLVPGSALLIPAAAAHSLRHTGSADLVVLAISSSVGCGERQRTASMM